MLFIGLFLLFGERLNLPQFGYNGNAEGLVRHGGWGAFVIGILFALAFCPTNGVFYFSILIPLSASTSGGYLLPIIFTVATAIPVLQVAWILAFSATRIGTFYGRIRIVQKWLNRIAGILFVLIGLYY